MDIETYHVLTKSIAGFKVFNQKKDFLRVIHSFKFFQTNNRPVSFSRYNICLQQEMEDVRKYLKSDGTDKVTIVAYCIMPTHLHLILRENIEQGMSSFMNNVLNSYTRYFNIKHNRKGPLWEGRFKRVVVEDDEQLLHLTRYIHLNPVTASLVDDPGKWLWSSYQEYLGMIKGEDRICRFEDIIDIDQSAYSEFVKDRISYQKELSAIKKTFPE
ncbi:MAG: transposase [Candidatus Omnitrophota bacterium]